MAFLDDALKQEKKSRSGTKPQRMTMEEVQQTYPWAAGKLEFDPEQRRQVCNVRCRGCGELMKDEEGQPLKVATSDLQFDMRCSECDKAAVEIAGKTIGYKMARKALCRAIAFNTLQEGTVDEEEVEELEIACCSSTCEEFKEAHLENVRLFAQRGAASYAMALNKHLEQAEKEDGQEAE